MVFFKNFCFSARFFFCQNSDSLKLVQLFDWKWVNRLDSKRGSSFFGQIPSFRPGKWHFFENYHFSALFFFRRNLDSRKFVKLLKWKWVNSQDSKGGSSFFRQILSFWPSKWHFFENFRFGAWLFSFAPKFKFAQIGANFRLEMG